MACRYLISLNQTVLLSEPLQRGGVVVFHSPELDLSPASHHVAANNTYIDFLASNGHVILHIGFRPSYDQLVFNSSAGAWMREDRIGFHGRFKDGQDHTVAVYDHGDRYQIHCDGEIALSYIKQLNGEVTSITYALDHDHGMFSDPILVEIYPDSAALARTTM